ncbi:MAG TPA: hypothetical protein VK169_12780 [Saprospiraceae bacterium]|nr:hypothetical protein [Saprospiraceae bacterium]
MINDLFLILWTIIKDAIAYSFWFFLVWIFVIFNLTDKYYKHNLLKSNKIKNISLLLCVAILPIIIALSHLFKYVNYRKCDESCSTYVLPNGEYMNLSTGDRLKVSGQKLMLGPEFYIYDYSIYFIGDKIKYCANVDCDPYQDYIGKCILPEIYDVELTYKGDIPLLEIKDKGDWIKIDKNDIQ